MAVIVPLRTWAWTGSALQKSKSNIVEAHRKKVRNCFHEQGCRWQLCIENCGQTAADSEMFITNSLLKS